MNTSEGALGEDEYIKVKKIKLKVEYCVLLTSVMSPGSPF